MASSRVDAKGVAWALFFLVVILALFDVMSTDSVIADFFTGGSGPSEGRIQRALRRATRR